MYASVYVVIYAVAVIEIGSLFEEIRTG